MKISRKLFSEGAKKALACGLSAAMVVAFAPTVAFGAPAADAATATWTSSTDNGSITGTLTTVIQKVNSLPAGTNVTITLNKDVTVGTTDDADAEQGTENTAGEFKVTKPVTLVGNGHSIAASTKTSNSDAKTPYGVTPLLTLAQGSSVSGLTITGLADENSEVKLTIGSDVVLTSAADKAGNAYAADSVVSGTITYTAKVDADSSKNIKGVNASYAISGTDADAIKAVGVVGKEGAGTDISVAAATADTLEGNGAVTVAGGTYETVTTVGKLTGGTVGTAEDVAEISGGTVTTVSVTASGKTSIKGGTFTGKKGTYTPASENGNTARTYEYYVPVNTVAEGGALEISGGTFTGYIVNVKGITGGTYAYDPVKAKYVTKDAAMAATANKDAETTEVENELAVNYAAYASGENYTVTRGIATDCMTAKAANSDANYLGLTDASKAALSSDSTAYLTAISKATEYDLDKGTVATTAIAGLDFGDITASQAAGKIKTAKDALATTQATVTVVSSTETVDVKAGADTLSKTIADYAKNNSLYTYNNNYKTAGTFAIGDVSASLVNNSAVVLTKALTVDAEATVAPDTAYKVLAYTAPAANAGKDALGTLTEVEGVENVFTAYEKASGNKAAKDATYTLNIPAASFGQTYVVVSYSKAAVAQQQQAAALVKIAEALGVENPEKATVEEILKAAEGVSEGTDAIKEILGEAYDEEKTLAENIAAVAEAAKTEQEATDVAAIKAAIEAAGLTYDESKSVAENVEAAITAAIKNQADVDAEALEKALEDAATKADKAQQEAVENAVKAAEEKAATEQEKALEEAAIAAKAEQEKAVAEAKAAAATAAANVKAAASKQLAKVKNKTVKAKAKKATGKTAKKKAVKLASTTGVTYAKAYTSYKKVTISKKGKVTVKKGAKKGTYKMVVVATCGDYAKTVTVTVKVK